MNKKGKIAIITTCGVIASLIVGVAGYVLYVNFSYYRIEDNLNLEVNKSASIKNSEVKLNTTYKASTYNIGFGAYSQDYTFFLDTGYDKDGNATCGHYSKAKSKNEVLFNVNGAKDTIKQLDVDFAMFQEVDLNATRSYHINENDLIKDSFADYDNVFALNFHSAFLPYPLYDMHGSVTAGLSTYSKYSITSATRKSYTVSEGFSKFFDLDRCFSYSVVKVENGKDLYIVNSHMSAYDSGGTIREKQLKELNDFLKERKDNDDYVLVGGDFNHDLLTYNKAYSYNEENTPFTNVVKTPDWMAYFFSKENASPVIDGYSVIAADNYPTCRNNDIEWTPGTTFISTIDGFIVSDNIKVTLNKNIQTKNGNKKLDGFAYSDHEPAYIEFELV